MTVWLAGGGTGGHVFPMVALAEMLEDSQQHTALVCLRDRIDQSLLQESPYRVVYQKLRRPGTSVLQRMVFLCSLLCVLVFWLFKLKRKDQVVSSGGYGSLPVLLAARIKGLRSLLYEPNAIDGKATRLLSRLSASPVVRPLLDTSPPLIRKDLYRLPVTDRTRLLVLGGSQGSLSLNRMFLKIWRQLLDNETYSGIDWITGSDGYEEVSGDVGAQENVNVLPFCTTMQDLYCLSSAAVARSGAGSVLELALWKIPAVYVPLPWAADDHQLLNARQAVARGWGSICPEGDDSQPLLESLLAMATRRVDGLELGTWEQSRKWWQQKVAA